MPHPVLTLQILQGELAVCRLDATVGLPGWTAASAFVSVTRTVDELSIVCDAGCVPPGVRNERGWQALQVQGPLDFGAVGILAAITGPLAEAGISLFALSTFDTDYVLVREASLPAATAALRAAGHIVRS